MIYTNFIEKILNNPTLNKTVQKGVERTLDGLNKGVDTIKKKIKTNSILRGLDKFFSLFSPLFFIKGS